MYRRLGLTLERDDWSGIALFGSPHRSGDTTDVDRLQKSSSKSRTASVSAFLECHTEWITLHMRSSKITRLFAGFP